LWLRVPGKYTMEIKSLEPVRNHTQVTAEILAGPDDIGQTIKFGYKPLLLSDAGIVVGSQITATVSLLQEADHRIWVITRDIVKIH
jgi:hypothetical protein